MLAVEGVGRDRPGGLCPACSRTPPNREKGAAQKTHGTPHPAGTGPWRPKYAAVRGWNNHAIADPNVPE